MLFRSNAGVRVALLALFSVNLWSCTCVAGEIVKRPARPAQCFLEIRGAHYIGGDCTFRPLDRAGSFQITTNERISAIAMVKTPGLADISWSGAKGDDTKVSVGAAYSDTQGCWSNPSKETVLCAWDKAQKLYLGPTPREQPASSLGWGERTGMYARIISRSGLDTEHAIVKAEKDPDGAVIWCRTNHDYSVKCIDDTLNNSPRTATMRADCKTKRFTDFIGRNLQILNGDILDLDTNEKLSNYAPSNSTVGPSAFATLCPKAAKRAN